MKRIASLSAFAMLLILCTSAQWDQTYFLFKWQWEPNEKTFKIMLPQDWISKGGIFRINLNIRGGAANALEAKFKFIIKNNTHETASVHWCPNLFDSGFVRTLQQLNHPETK